jgi:hypothetical protein
MREKREILEDQTDPALLRRHEDAAPAQQAAPSRISPWSGVSSPAIIRSKVLLPQPDAPRRQEIFRLPTVRLASSTARRLAVAPGDLSHRQDIIGGCAHWLLRASPGRDAAMRWLSQATGRQRQADDQQRRPARLAEPLVERIIVGDNRKRVEIERAQDQGRRQFLQDIDEHDERGGKQGSAGNRHLDGNGRPSLASPERPPAQTIDGVTRLSPASMGSRAAAISRAA